MNKKASLLIFAAFLFLFSSAFSIELNQALTKYAKNPNEWSALNYAIELDDYESALILIDFVKDPKHIDGGRNALYRVFERAEKNEQTKLTEMQAELIKKLITKGLDVHSHPDRHPPPIKFAVEFENEEIVQILLVKGVKEEDSECVYTAVNLKNYKILDLLLQHGANINGNILTPLACAVTAGDLKMVDYLIKKGANPNKELGFFEELDGDTSILGLAIKANHTEIIEMLLRNDAKLR